VVSDAYDNALAEITVRSFKNELIRRRGPWRDIDQVEIGTLNWVDWFNNERPHEYLADLTPPHAEALRYRHKSSLATVG
jgi:putative transposase